MGILILILIFVTTALIIFTFYPFDKTDKPKKEHQKPITPKLEIPLSSLKSELEKLKTDYQNLQNEFTLTKNRESDLKKELERFKDWDNREQTDLEKIKKEHMQLKKDLIAKEKEIEQGFALNVNLNKELNERKEKIGLLEKEKSQMLESLRMLKAKITGFQKEIEKQNNIIAQMKKKEAGSEWVSKEEYNELKIQLAAQEEELKKLRGG